MHVALFSWCTFSLGTPYLATMYVQQLGKLVGLKRLGESGHVMKNDITVKDDSLNFIKDMQISGMFPIFTFCGPLAIPISLIFVFCATLDFVVFIVYDNFWNRHHDYF